MEQSKPKTRRCAVYTRKSSEEGLEQNFNSLHAQRRAATRSTSDRDLEPASRGLYESPPGAKIALNWALACPAPMTFRGASCTKLS